MIRPVTAQALHGVRAAVLGASLIAALLPGAATAATRPVPLTDGGAQAAPTGSTVTLVKVADVPQPVLAIGAHDGTDRLFIV